jgi:phosphoribosylanthranilate isomerase
MRVKICGLTNYEDAKLSVDFGADALGFIFYKDSKRFIHPQDAKKIIAKLPPFVQKVGLFVNHSIDEINEISKNTKINLAQIHFELQEKLYDKIQIEHIKVIRASKQNDILNYQNEYRLCDTMTENYGGSGKRIAVEWFDNIDCSNIILAGGLNHENLDSLKNYNFFGVDVSSGTEASYGKKDKIKLQQFIEKAKSL